MPQPGAPKFPLPAASCKICCFQETAGGAGDVLNRLDTPPPRKEAKNFRMPLLNRRLEMGGKVIMPVWFFFLIVLVGMGFAGAIPILVKRGDETAVESRAAWNIME